jgi:glycosyltransferase involved in cell wall biosynthesis
VTDSRLIIVVNCPTFFLSHRLQIALAAQKVGYDVHIATGPGTDVKKILAAGLVHHPLPLSRSGMNVILEFWSLLALLRLFRKLQPSIVHLVTIKPVLYGGIAARLVGIDGVVAAVSGLGFIFEASGFKATIISSLVARMYRLALGKHNLKVIFQNPDDCETLLRATGLQRDKVVMIKGSGANLSEYNVTPMPKGIPVVVMATRLIRDKGVYEFIEAAKQLKSRGLIARFWLAGGSDPGNPTNLDEKELSAWRNAEAVDILGHRNDIAHVFSKSSIVVLPSYYREGLPKVLIEAAACGRPVVTTDMPGCRDAIEHEITGLLVPPRDVAALADAIERLLLDAELREQMGRSSRQLAEREFSIEKVISTHLEVYCELKKTAS